MNMGLPWSRGLNNRVVLNPKQVCKMVLAGFFKSSLKNYMQLNHSTSKSTVDINPKQDQIDTGVNEKPR